MEGLFVIFIMLFFIVGLFLLNIITSIWAYRDSINKGNSKEYALLILLGTLFFPVLGLIIYLIIRNN
ncbi:Phospholipase_D-nuclease N-terminal [Alteribacillus iranensis]|uniref:Phospholipase_D-nuclease N-terminal n=2 Tax=Alteribacillus iranensis TaxID=930128 RepID=A0A1I2FAH7_9BACI|nr:Phospholipase_D-nuclease N-terminal [Alteribacillus iranensis]